MNIATRSKTETMKHQTSKTANFPMSINQFAMHSNERSLTALAMGQRRKIHETKRHTTPLCEAEKNPDHCKLHVTFSPRKNPNARNPNTDNANPK